MNRYEVTLKTVSPSGMTEIYTRTHEARSLGNAAIIALRNAFPGWEIVKLKVKKVRR